MKTRKREEIYANRYENLEQLRTNSEEFIELYYNQQRLQSALGYRSPEEFERESGRTNSADSPGATVEFVVHNENRALRLGSIEMPVIHRFANTEHASIQIDTFPAKCKQLSDPQASQH